MPRTPAAQDHPRLSLTWRRHFVRLLTIAAVGLLITRSLAGIPPLLRYAGGALCLIVAVATLWFLLDSIRPWLAREGGQDAAALRALAGSRAHAGLVWLAAGGWLYIWAQEAASVPLPPAQLELTELLVGFFLAGLFLPIAAVAWLEPESGPAVGPLALLRSRLSGADAAGHWISVGLVALCGALAAFAASPIGMRSATGRAFLLTALALIVAATLAIVWLWFQSERRGGSDVGR